jgi:hypothetical protein
MRGSGLVQGGRRYPGQVLSLARAGRKLRRPLHPPAVALSRVGLERVLWRFLVQEPAQTCCLLGAENNGLVQ